MKTVIPSIYPIRKAWPQIYFLHYMDDIFLGAPTEAQVLQCFQQLQTALSSRGLKTAPDKILFQAPYSYLGFQFSQDRVFTPKIELHLASLKTIHDFQQLLGNLQFLRPYLKIPPNVLLPLHD